MVQTSNILTLFWLLQILCCHLTACRSCVDKDELINCPICQSEITRKDFKVDQKLIMFLEAAKSDWRHWQEQTWCTDETEMLREALECRLCGQLCSKAVSLTCCGPASCRKCAISQLKVNKQQCWSCGYKTGSVITPSQLINNHLVRAGVHLFTREGKVSSKSSFIFFLLLDSIGKGVCCQCPDSDKLNVSYSRKTYQSSRILDKSEIVPHVIPERHKTVKPQISSNNSSQSPPAYKLVRVPHTYNGVLTVIATVKVPI